MVPVDPHTGERTPIVRLGAGRGGGPPLEDPTGLAVEASGSLVVTDSGLDAVVRVEPHTGDRTVVSGCPASTPRGLRGGPVGGGHGFEGPATLALEFTGPGRRRCGAGGGGARQPPHRRPRDCVRLPGHRCTGSLRLRHLSGKARASAFLWVSPSRPRARWWWSIGGAGWAGGGGASTPCQRPRDYVRLPGHRCAGSLP